MTTLAVVTLSNAARRQGRFYRTSRASTERWTPPGARYVELECPEPAAVERLRIESLGLADWICYVDDDDVVVNNGIGRLWEIAQRRPDLGMLFTDEERIDVNGNHIGGDQDRQINYHDLTDNPNVAHHLCMFRPSAINPDALRLGEALGIGVEWLMKSSAGLGHGAGYSPGYGYQWRQHDSVSKTPTWQGGYAGSLHLLRSYLKTRSVRQGLVESFEETTAP